MERSEEGDAREIAAWQIAGPGHRNYVFVAAALSDKKSIPVQILSIFALQVGWGILNDGKKLRIRLWKQLRC
jgi:hypothetical protein